jgi:methyltransferase (TIGR00027 family)
MIEDQFSRTAIAVAGMRAAHQIAEGGAVLSDPFAARILGEDLPALLERFADPELRPLRLFVALRSRIAEDVARRAIATGAKQIVVLGAGLDTFACRGPPIAGVEVFEVDHPATQAEKRRRLAAAGIEAPALRFAPCEFERESLAQALQAAGFDPTARAAFLWLGVTPYLSAEAVDATLRFVAGLEGGADIVFDYANPPQSIDSPGHRLFHERMAARVAELGESFKSYFDTAELRSRLEAMGFEKVADLGPREISQRFAPGSPPPPENGGHILHASFRRR